MEPTLSLPRYTLQFRNGWLLRHQGPLALAQFRCDGRLARFWLESDAQAVGVEPSFPGVH
jgi:hypothetical protein